MPKGHILLIRMLTSTKYGLTIDEITEKLKAEGYDKFSRSTLTRWRREIEEMFGLKIAPGKDYRYRFVDESTDVEKQILTMLTSAFSLNELSNTPNRVSVELPSIGYVWLPYVAKAIADCRCLSFEYESLQNPELHHVVVEPFMVKNFHQRWYLLGNNAESSKLAVYSLERMSNVEIVPDSHFTFRETMMRGDEKIAVKDYFDNCYGISLANDKPELVYVKVAEDQTKYFDALPLHHSQKQVNIDEEGNTTYCYYLVLNHEFKKEILSWGSKVEVLQPQRFKNEIEKELSMMLKVYGR